MVLAMALIAQLRLACACFEGRGRAERVEDADQPPSELLPELSLLLTAANDSSLAPAVREPPTKRSLP